MIFNTIAKIIYSFLNSVINIFPVADTSIIADITSKTTDFYNVITEASWIFPVNQFFIVIGLMLSIEISLFTYRLIKLILSYVSLGFLRD
jgi:hypothetical protein